MGLMGSVRIAMRGDLDQIVDIYLECFPERAREVFGGGNERTFIRDYLGFYLSWDPDSNWVYVDDDKVLAWIIAPCQYSPLISALSHGQVFRWVIHFLLGKYGFPIHIVRRFLLTGFTFNLDQQIRRMWGKPFIHGIAVAGRVRRQGVATELVRRMLEGHQSNGHRFCFGILRPGNTQAVALLEKAGFKVSHLTPENEPVMIFEVPA